MNELRELFFESASELVEKLNEEALRLEKIPNDAETARSLRRIVHTLKGDAAACGYRELSELAHEFEDVLALKTNDAIIPEVALRAADVFGALIHAYRAGEKLPDLKPLRDEIARLANPKPESSPPREAAGTETEGRKKPRKPKETVPWSEYERLAISHAAEDGKRLHHVIVQIDPQCGMPIAARPIAYKRRSPPRNPSTKFAQNAASRRFPKMWKSLRCARKHQPNGLPHNPQARKSQNNRSQSTLQTPAQSTMPRSLGLPPTEQPWSLPTTFCVSMPSASTAC